MELDTLAGKFGGGLGIGHGERGWGCVLGIGEGNRVRGRTRG